MEDILTRVKEKKISNLEFRADNFYVKLIRYYRNDYCVTVHHLVMNEDFYFNDETKVIVNHNDIDVAIHWFELYCKMILDYVKED